MHRVVMTVIGPDRPGLVDSLAAIIADHGGNWLESRMSRLGGQFAGILRVEAPADRAQALDSALKALPGLTVVLSRDTLALEEEPLRLTRLEIVGQDRPGIVSQIASVLADHNVNVEALESELASAPMTGEPLFTARAKLRIPPDCDMVQLRTKLEKLAADLIVDIKLDELPGN